MIVLQVTKRRIDNDFHSRQRAAPWLPPVTVSFDNIFITMFETQILKTVKSLHGKEPILWLRFIQSVFFVRVLSPDMLLDMLHFCDCYVENS